MRLSRPVKVIAIERTHPCILLNLSRAGTPAPENRVAAPGPDLHGSGAMLRAMGVAPSLPSRSDDPLAVGRRAAARLRLAIPARFVSICSTQTCILLDLSRSGARLALQNPLNIGQSGLIAVARFEVFGTILRAESGPDGGVNAMVFEEPIATSQVLEIRRFADDFAQRERNVQRDQVRRWVAGED